MHSQITHSEHLVEFVEVSAALARPATIAAVSDNFDSNRLTQIVDFVVLNH